MDVRATRASFEDVLANQEKLRKWLDNLVKEDRPLKPEERGPFLQLVARATLGQGGKIPLVYGDKSLRLHLYTRECASNAEDFFRFIAYYNGQHLELFESKLKPSALWRWARELAFKTFPLALDRATSISAERVSISRVHSTGRRLGDGA